MRETRRIYWAEAAWGSFNAWFSSILFALIARLFETRTMHLRIILAALVLSFLALGSGLAKAASSAPLHTFCGEVKAVDLAAKTITIKSGGKSLVFHVTDETKISSRNEHIRLDTVTRGQGATVVMRLGEGNVGIAVMIRFDADASLSKYLSLFSARTTRGETISGLAVNNYVAYQPPDDGFSRGLDFGMRRLGMFLLSVQPDGAVANVTSLKSLGYEELDVRAAKWLKKWRFRPNNVTEVRIPAGYYRTR